MKHETATYYTKRMFADALKEAARTKPLARITVSELVRACGVNRKTFYYHFQDIYALTIWIIDEEAVRVVQQFHLLTDYREATRFVLDYMLENDYLLCLARDPVGYDTLKRFLMADFTAVLRSVIDDGEKQAGAVLEPEFKNYAARFYTEALTGMVMEWARNRPTETRDQVLEYLTRILAVALDGMLTMMKRS